MSGATISGMIERVRTRVARRIALLALTAALAPVLSGCVIGGPEEPDSTAEAFAAALTSGDAQAAANLTTDPGAAATAITAMFDGLGTREAHFGVARADSSDAHGTFTLAAEWRFGEGGVGAWNYTTTGAAAQSGDDWKIVWDPAVLAPGLTPDKALRYTPTTGTPPRIFDRAGRPIMEQQVVTLVNVDAAANPASVVAVAALIAPVVPTVTADTLQAEVTEAQGRPITAITLRESDVAPIRSRLAAIPGVTLVRQTRLLTVDKSLASPVLGGLADLWQDGQDASAGWAVQLVDHDGSADTIAGQNGPVAPDIHTTLDLPMQYAAKAAIADLKQEAAIVELQPSTGAVLAIAQNAAADAQGAIALTGLYPPGSTFKTVTTSAALQAGAATPDTVLPCPGTENIEGRQIPNDDHFDLGSVPLHSAFAHSCNTTMGRLAVGLSPDALTRSALQFGLGVDYVTPGLVTVTGRVPHADTPAQRVESAIGQGQVTASPFGMALVAASIANGSTPVPVLVSGRPATADQTPPPVPGEVADALQRMMRETVTDGTATSLRGIPELHGKTGTAEYGVSTDSHGWFVGTKGDLAFAVFVARAGSSAPALEAAGQFLR